MNYLSLTVNRLFTLCCALLLIISGVQAQKNTYSAYSKYEAGLIKSKAYVGNAGMGGMGYAWRPLNYRPLINDSLSRSSINLNDRRSNYINPKNPSSYSNLSLTVFEVAAFSSSTLAVSEGQSQLYNSAQLSHVALAFPIGKKWGAGFGLRPFSIRGYDYSQVAEINNELVEYSYEGSGGLNQLYATAAKEFGESFSLGVSASYIFGRLLDQKRVVYNKDYSANFFNSLDQSSKNVGDLYLETGLQYYTDLNEKYRMVVGLFAAPQANLKAESNQIVGSYEGEPGLEEFKDTVLNITSKNTRVELAPIYGGGFGIEKTGKWLIGLDYSLRSWRSYQTSIEGVSFVNNHQIALGYESFSDLSSFGSYFKQMGYRFGAQYNSSLIQIEGKSIPEFGISFGVALPLRRSLTTLNLAFEAGRRGLNQSNLIEENFFNIHFGAVINDKWFTKRKYD